MAGYTFPRNVRPVPLSDIAQDGAQDGQVLVWSDASGSWVPSYITGSGGGDVFGPGSSTDNALARYDGTTGKIIQNSSAILSDSGDLSLSGSLYVDGTGSIFIKTHSDYPGSYRRLTTCAVQTTDASFTNICTINSAADSIYWVYVKIAAREDNTVGENAVFIRQAKLVRQGTGSVELGKKGMNSTFTDKTNNSMNVEFTPSGSNLNIRVRGLSSKTINWVCSLDYQKIGLAA